MSTSSPCFQLAGVATLCFAISWSESITRNTSSKLRPVCHRIDHDQLDLLVGPDHEHVAHGLDCRTAVRFEASPLADAGQHAPQLGDLEVGVADHRKLRRMPFRLP